MSILSFVTLLRYFNTTRRFLFSNSALVCCDFHITVKVLLSLVSVCDWWAGRLQSALQILSLCPEDIEFRWPNLLENQRLPALRHVNEQGMVLSAMKCWTTFSPSAQTQSDVQRFNCVFTIIFSIFSIPSDFEWSPVFSIFILKRS